MREKHPAQAGLTLVGVVSAMACGASPDSHTHPGDEGLPSLESTAQETEASGEVETQGGDGIYLDVGSNDSGPETGTGDPSGDGSPALWYSVDDRLVLIRIDPATGEIAEFVESVFTNSPPLQIGQSGITMLDDGSLLISRENEAQSVLYHVPNPPTTASELEAQVLGVIPDAMRIEALYTDCEGRVYLMDTGLDVGGSDGNRLVRLIGDYLDGDFTYEVITDLASATVADIDDMSPGVAPGGGVSDGLGLALDTGDLYRFDYVAGDGEYLGQAGHWGIHVLGGPLFADGLSRLYVMTQEAEVFLADPDTLALSPSLGTGPDIPGANYAGWSGLAGPLTDCESTFPPIP